MTYFTQTIYLPFKVPRIHNLFTYFMTSTSTKSLVDPVKKNNNHSSTLESFLLLCVTNLVPDKLSFVRRLQQKTFRFMSLGSYVFGDFRKFLSTMDV